MSDREWLSIAEVDRLIADFVWLERRRFEVLGAWVATVPEPEAAALLTTCARHHAWHASLWSAHLPRRSGYLAPAQTRSEGVLSGLVDAVAFPSGPLSTLVLLTGAFSVLATHVLAGYAMVLSRTTTVSDAALIRTCRLVVADQQADHLEGGRLLGGLSATAADAEQADRHRRALEGLLPAPGLLFA